MIIGIVADDLTGAADSAAPFANRGYHADVAFTIGEKLTQEVGESEARAWSVETREISPERRTTITRLTRAATRRLQAFSPRIYYKKIDSTLRGHLRLELDAMRLELPGRLAIVCSAFPANGRTVRSGILYVKGEPKRSAREAFGMAEDPNVGEIFLHALRTQSLPQTLMRMHREGIHTVFCDAETDQDLARLARAIWQISDSWLPVGSAGLSSALAAQLPGQTNVHLSAVTQVFKENRILVVVGSRNPVSRRQAAYLADRAKLSPVVFGDEFAAEGMQKPVREQFEAGRRIVLLLSPDAPREDVEYSMSHFALWARTVLQTEGLILTGGDTARKSIALPPCSGLRIAGETRPGIVAGTLIGSGDPGERLNGMAVLLKSGGFGTDEMLAECLGIG